MALVPDTQLVLGDVTFAAYEVPERIPFGGEQRLVVQKYIGGGRVVEALGPDDKELCWSGRFQSPNAGPRARHLDYLRRQGAAQTLSWDQFSYTVVIRAFEADYERAYQIPYRIACLVVADNTQPIAASPSAPVDELVSADAAALSSLASASGNAAIASGVGSLQSLLASVGALAQAARRLARADPEPAREPRRADRGRHRGSGKRLRRRPRGFWRHGGRRGGGGSTSLSGERS